MSEKPRLRAYMEEDEVNNFENVYRETGTRYVIDWFVWKTDGRFTWPDWEPLLTVFSEEDDVKTCAVRRAFRWEKYQKDEIAFQDDVLEILFEGQNHHPIIRTYSSHEDFDTRKNNFLQISCTPARIQKNDVPEYARDSKALLWKFPSLKHFVVELYPYVVNTPSVDEKVVELLSWDC
ncbi:MAG: hypothetical protein QXQ70_01250 [Candidatus Caldarchaeum sp.]